MIFASHALVLGVASGLGHYMAALRHPAAGQAHLLAVFGAVGHFSPAARYAVKGRHLGAWWNDPVARVRNPLLSGLISS